MNRKKREPQIVNEARGQKKEKGTEGESRGGDGDDFYWLPSILIRRYIPSYKHQSWKAYACIVALKHSCFGAVGSR